MRIIIARHAVAEDDAKTDAARRLTEEGRKQAEQMGGVLKATIPLPEEIWTSPAVRCKETAELAAKTLGFAGTIKVVQELSPGADPGQIAHLCAKSKKGIVMLSGHAPDVGLLASRLLGFTTVHKMSKGSLCIIDIDDPVHPPGRSVATLDPNQYAGILRGETYIPWAKGRLTTAG